MPNLVGTGLNQVPTNGMLGGLAYQDPNHASIKNLDLKNLSQINSEIADTATDVFVYDTSKDSDGGAWRKRTQNTSWYNETLGTADRGTRKEFPAVAVIVLSDSPKAVTIYDGDDPDLPMWMVFIDRGNYSSMLFESNPACITALNGKVACGSAGYDLNIVDFISDSGVSYSDSNTISGTFKHPISERNTVTYSSPSDVWTFATVPNIISRTINDVAMTVLPNAPIDSATGLPVPTIVVGTASGTSVIKDDGTVADYTGFSPSEKVAIDSKYVYSATRSGTNDYIFKTTFNSADASYDANITAGSGGWYANSVNNGSETPTLKNMTVTDVAITKDSSIIRSGNDGIEIFDGNVTTVDGNEAIMPFAYITSDYNTGYMVGDIKGAFLSDTDTGEDFGSEIVTGGDFSNASQWTLGTGWSINGSGQAVHTGSAGYIEQAGTFTGGRYYQMTADLISGSAGNFGMTNRNEPNVAQPHNQSTLVDVYCVGGTKIYAMWQQRSGVNLNTINLYANSTLTIDNVSIKEISRFYYDRSVNNSTLALIGSLTKTPVATGADLVAYSGFNASNYLRHTHASNYGNGATITLGGWCKLSTSDTTADYNYLCSVRNTSASITCGVAIRKDDATGGGKPYFYENTNSALQSAGPRVDNDQWHHVIGVLDGTANTKKIYIDGELIISANVSGVNLSAVDVTNVGHYVATSGSASEYYFRGSLALIKFSATAASAEQIKKMYNDEKHLFLENAKATLYGSSDAVTALAYDEVTDQLHVGTSAGRSDFQGLRRINNTTTAVTTAISAHDEFIIEQ